MIGTGRMTMKKWQRMITLNNGNEGMKTNEWKLMIENEWMEMMEWKRMNENEGMQKKEWIWRE